MLLKDIIQDCNFNFLLGSGLSSPYLKTLGRIELLLTQLEEMALPADEDSIVRCSLYKAYFDGVMSKNCNILQNEAECIPTLNNYYAFLEILNVILLRRKSTILGKEVNLFTTNIDICLEKAIEHLGLECNDGFAGRFRPAFSISNFKKAHFKRSPQYDNVSEIPTINLLKLHGSLTWELEGNDRVVFSSDLKYVKNLQAKAITPTLLLRVDEKTTLESLLAEGQGKKSDPSVKEFLEAYSHLLIVNPTKTKFRQTLLNQTHYELLRIYSNELEKENTVLFVLGFSFADEHIREITLRAANSNPTLMVYVVAYDSESAIALEAKFHDLAIRNDNVEIVKPPIGQEKKDSFKYDLATINKKILREVLGLIHGDSVKPSNVSPA
jgi:SIR2-like domain